MISKRNLLKPRVIKLMAKELLLMSLKMQEI